MAVAVPVAGADMHLHVSGPEALPYPDLGIEKIRPRVAVLATGVDDAYPAPVDGDEVGVEQQPVPPHILHQLFQERGGIIILVDLVILVGLVELE